MLSCYDAGYYCVIDQDDRRPLKAPLARVVPANAHEPEEWLKGYDTGLLMASTWREGYKVGRVNDNANECPYPPQTDQSNWTSKYQRYFWFYGFNAGRRLFLTKHVKTIVDAAYPDKKTGLVLITHHYPDEEDYGSRGRTSVKPISRKDLVKGSVALMMEYDSAGLPDSIGSVIGQFRDEAEGDGSWCNCGVETVKEYKQRKAEEKFKQMEEAAQQFSANCGHPPGTMAFLKALEKAIAKVRQEREQWNSHEVRMEEYAACRYAGVGTDVYFDDLNFENGRYEERRASLSEVWSYIEKQFPLCMMRYREAKERRKTKRSK